MIPIDVALRADIMSVLRSRREGIKYMGFHPKPFRAITERPETVPLYMVKRPPPLFSLTRDTNPNARGRRQREDTAFPNHEPWPIVMPKTVCFILTSLGA